MAEAELEHAEEHPDKEGQVNDRRSSQGDTQNEFDEAAEEEAQEKVRREREARAQALTLEIVGDLPYAEVKPPENVLFVCKLNPVTEGQSIYHVDLLRAILRSTSTQMTIWTQSSAALVRYFHVK